MKPVVLSLVATIGLVAIAACSGGMQQTPLPGVESQPAAQAPAPATSSDASDAPDTSDGSGDEVPVSDVKPLSQSLPSQSPRASAPASFRYACRHAQSPDRRECDALVRAQPRRPCAKAAPYCASDLQAAYGVTQAAKARGKGAIVAIVAAYGYSNASTDLAVYRKSMGLPACSPSTGCLKIVNERGRATPLPKPNADSGDDWRPEQALDLAMVSAICPNCKLLLVQTNTNKNTDLAAGVNAAAALSAVAISNSYSGTEVSAADPAYAHRGRAITASAGDDGTGARQPCSYAGVVCVGGTTLSPPSSGAGWRERAWRYTGSGCSEYVARPAWQRLHGCAMRSEADVSAVADPASGVAFYELTGGGWQQAGGTSVATPIVAAIFALAPSAARANAPQWIWRHGGSSTYRDIVSGDNGECPILYVCHARKGYDGPTGWGTPARMAAF
jgi:hypothetical protein